MNYFNQTTRTHRATRRCAGGRADERGSAIVLVLVSVVLMAVLAATLLQVTRFERIPRPVSNIDIVVESVIDEIMNQATSDLIDDQGNIFNHRNVNGGGDEPWDFPWTNPGPNGVAQPGAFGRVAERINGTTVDVLGGWMDDPWLASTAPDFRTAGQFSQYPNTLYTIPNGAGGNNDGVWRKITSLTGMFVGGNNGSKDLSTTTRGDKNPNEYPVVSFVSELNSDSNIRVNHPDDILVDADGDGVGDSRWEWAPIRQIGTTRYVMAVRIIDLSSRLDLNVAMGRGAPNALTSLRGDTPAEIDGHTFAGETAASAGLSSGVAQEEWRKVLNFRLTGYNPPPNQIAANQPTAHEIQKTPLPNTRRHYWEYGASRVSPIFGRNGASATSSFDYSAGSTFGLADAFELLQRNGLNSANTTQLEELMPNFLRDGSAEPNFASLTRLPGTNWDQRDFWERDPRKQVSPFSGAMAIRRPAGTTLRPEPKVNVNTAMESDSGLRELSKVIREVFTAGSWSNLKFQRFDHLADESEAAMQLALNIKDYSDSDNYVTELDGVAGFEALPYITEVYTQRPYVAVNVQPAAPPATQDTVTWVSDPNNGMEQGYAIEIGNPFGTKVSGTWQGRPVSLEKVFIDFNGSKIELSSLPGAPTKLEAGEVLIIRRDSKGHTPDTSKDDISRLYGTGVKTIHDVDVTTDARFDWFVNRRNLSIQLHATITAGAKGTPKTASWPYSACEVEVSPPVIPAEGVNAATGVQVGQFGYIQTNYQGYGDGLRMMTVIPKPKSKAAANRTGFGDTNNGQSLGKPSYNWGATGASLKIKPELGKVNKQDGPKEFKSLYAIDQQIAWQDNPRDQMQWIGDVLQIPIIGPDPRAAGNQSNIAEKFNRLQHLRNMPNAQGMGIESLMLPFQMTNATQSFPLGVRGVPINNTPTTSKGGHFGLFNIPHGLLLLERIATISPAMDKADGDGEGDSETVAAPDRDEMLVPGRINLNTASEQTLARALPFPDQATRLAIARAIVQRRESMRQQTNHVIGSDNVPGIQYVSSLYEQLETLGFAANPSRDNADNIGINGNRIDWNNNETSVGTFSLAQDGVVDDREEQIMLAKWLSEVADNRSDVFAAYIVVQGYSADDFTTGAVESRRLIILFSRATVKGNLDQAVEIGRFTFD